MTYLDVASTIEILIYPFVVLLFLVTGFLNLQDLRSMRQEKWTRQDTIALVLRVLFYAFLLNFLIIAAANIATLLYAATGTTLPVQQALGLAVTPVQFSLVIVLISGAIYGLAKQKDWYDLIDAED